MIAIPIFVATSRSSLGRQAGEDIAAELRQQLKTQRHVRMIFAAAPSQAEMLEALAVQPDVDWSRVTAFHMDEYIGLPEDAPQLFGNWLRRMLFDRLPFAAVQLIAPIDADPQSTAHRYARKLAEAPIDIVCLGIGTNGHLAFNDPPADLNDPLTVRVVALDPTCRQQQVDDRCFEGIEDVPTHAITLTVPCLLAARRLFCVVPGAAKREAVRKCLGDPVSGLLPATALRLHPGCSLYLDLESALEGVTTNARYCALSAAQRG